MQVLYLKLFFGFLLSFLITFYVIPILATLAIKIGALDNPDGRIKIHKKPTPYFGGLAIYIGFITSLSLVFPFENQIFLFLLGSTLLLFLGLIDDLIITKPYQKLFGQIIATLCFLKAGFHLKETFFLYNFWRIPLSALWILLVINAFNLVDVMDGLATSLAIYVSFSFMIIALCLHQGNLALLLSIFLGTLAAFFWYNRPRAQMYLGDAGSLFIGGILATTPFLLNWSYYNIYGLLTPICLLAIPLLEVNTLIIIRSYKGIPFYYGSPDHFSIYLRTNGWSNWGILGYVGILSLFLFSFSLIFVLNIISLFYLVCASLLFLAFWFYMLLHKIK